MSYSNNKDFGNTPLSNVELEKAILGSIILEKEAISRVNLIETDFYFPKHIIIFKAISKLHERSIPIDIITLTEQLSKEGVLEDAGGAYYVTLLSASISSSSNLEYHCAILRELSIKRDLLYLSNAVGDMAGDPTVDYSNILEFIESKQRKISTMDFETESSDIVSSIMKTVSHYEEIENNRKDGEIVGIPTGSKNLDKELNGGWQKPDLVILGGRPSEGKTQFAVKFAKSCAEQNLCTLFISIEMTKIQLITRLLTEDDRIDFFRLKTGRLSNEDWGYIEERISELQNLNLYIEDGTNISNLQIIKSKARKLKKTDDLQLLIIDYLQLIETGEKFGTRDLEIGYITRNLKALAKELNIPIILLSQLKRKDRGVKVYEPKLEDLRESGNIEQDADIVAFIHNPASGLSPDDETAIEWHNKIKFIIAKNREGQRDVTLLFQRDDKFKKIWDLDINNQTNMPF